MRAFAAVTRVTLQQLLGGRRLVVLGLLGALPAVVVWLSTGGPRTTSSMIDIYHEAGLVLLFVVVMPIVSIVLASAALGDERRDGTLPFLLVRPVPRSVIVAAKLVAAWIAAAGVTAASGALTASAAALRVSDWSLLVPTVVALAISVLGYVAVFVVAGYLTGRAVLAGLVYLFVWESGISFAATALANVSLFRIGITAYVAMRPEASSVLSEPLAALAPGTGGAVAKVIVLSILAIAATATMLRSRDTT